MDMGCHSLLVEEDTYCSVADTKKLEPGEDTKKLEPGEDMNYSGEDKDYFEEDTQFWLELAHHKDCLPQEDSWQLEDNLEFRDLAVPYLVK